MSDILRMHEEMDFLIDGDRHFGGYDVVPGIHIMLGIEAVEILRSLINELGVKWAELSIRTGIAEIESELASLDLDRHGIRRRRGEIDIGPCLDSKDSEGHDFYAYDQYGSNPPTPSACRKILDLCIGPRVGEFPDKKSQNELRGEKGDASLRHGFRHLLIDQRSMSRDVLWCHPSVSQDGNRGKDRDYDDSDRKEFCHDALALTGFSPSSVVMNRPPPRRA